LTDGLDAVMAVCSDTDCVISGLYIVGWCCQRHDRICGCSNTL